MRAVNLLPKEESRAAAVGGLRVPALVGGGAALAVATAVGLLTLSASSKLHDRRAELAVLRVELAAHPQPAAPPAWVARVQGAQAQRSTALAAALGQRLWWDRVVSELAAVLPQGVWLTRVEGTLSDPAAALPVAPAAASAASNGLTIEGVTATHALVADLLGRLTVVPDFDSVQLQSSAVSQQPGSANPVQFRVLVGLRTPGAGA